MPKPTTPQPKQILCIHDLSCYGRCSLSVILPVLATMGHQPVALPIVTYSTHTGGLGTPAKLSGESFAAQTLAHYNTLGIAFDCIYTGYLATSAGIALAKEAFAQYPDAYKIVDPVMGDHGKAYSSITADFMAEMRTLCALADLILPNYTEAHLLLGLTESSDTPTKESALALAEQLTPLCATPLITGIPLAQHIACACGGEQGFYHQNNRLPRSFPGTGDLFGAVLLSAFLRGNALCAASEIAANFISNAILNTADDADTRLGVWYEPLLRTLL